MIIFEIKQYQLQGCQQPLEFWGFKSPVVESLPLLLLKAFVYVIYHPKDNSLDNGCMHIPK